MARTVGPAATNSRLLKSSLRPMTRALFQVYQDHDPTIASPSCLGGGWLCVGGSRLPQKNPASFGPTETPPGPTCTPQGHPITSSFHTNKELTSTAWRGLPMWLGPRHPFPTPSCCWAAVVLQRPLQRLCQVLRSGQVFNFFVAGGGAFALRHNGYHACGIPDEDTIVMTGGGDPHDYVTR